MAQIILKQQGQKLKSKHSTRAMALGKYVSDNQKYDELLLQGFLTEPQTLEDAVFEMANICDLADPSGQRKIMEHWTISWKLEDGETPPDKEKMFKAAAEAWEETGHKNCPAIFALHTNTDHPHIHITGPRVDPIENKVLRDSFSHLKAQAATVRIAHKHGWEVPDGTRYQLDENGEITPKGKPDGKKGRIRSKARAEEELTGLKSGQRILSETLEEFCNENRQYFSAWKWGDLHRALAMRGVEMAYTDRGGNGGGLAFSLDGQTWEKASIACPELSYPNISQTLGAKGRYRKARPEARKLLEEARAKLDQRPQPMTLPQPKPQPMPAPTPTPAPIPQKRINKPDPDSLKKIQAKIDRYSEIIRDIEKSIDAPTKEQKAAIRRLDEMAYTMAQRERARRLEKEELRLLLQAIENFIAAIFGLAQLAILKKQQADADYEAEQTRQERIDEKQKLIDRFNDYLKKTQERFNIEQLLLKEAESQPLSLQKQLAFKKVCEAHKRELRHFEIERKSYYRILATRLKGAGHSKEEALQIMIAGKINERKAARAIISIYENPEALSNFTSTQLAQWKRIETPPKTGSALFDCTPKTQKVKIEEEQEKPEETKETESRMKKVQSEIEQSMANSKKKKPAKLKSWAEYMQDWKENATTTEPPEPPSQTKMEDFEEEMQEFARLAEEHKKQELQQKEDNYDYKHYSPKQNL